MRRKNVMHRITKILVDIMFYLGIICVIAVPFLSDFISRLYGCGEYTKIPMTVVLAASGILAVYILFNLKSMYKTLLSGNPFILENVLHFKKMAVSCILISAIYLIKCIFMFTIATLIIIIVFAIGSLFCLTLMDLFAQAIDFKEENDLTI